MVRAGFRPFYLLDNGIVLAIFRCLPEPESLGCAALVSKRLAGLLKRLSGRAPDVSYSPPD
ncbi:hypothetical protein T492DRAFT_910088 [Pavlovales sp. CCMP2436]|nr:hypothetical protein T492DRAFT_910088 [Pavlovales sp. CCMP2436]